jgi:hypothetical protein
MTRTCDFDSSFWPREENIMGRNAQALSGQVQPGAKPFAKGGKVHSDEKADRALIRKTVKPSALTGKKCGGKAK